MPEPEPEPELELELELDERLIEAWAGVRGRAGSVLVLAGAGVSAQSGIPTFRGAEGYWTIGSRNYRPEELATVAEFQRQPTEVWRWYLFRRSICRAAAPNDGHRALVQLEEQLGDNFSLVTQNVDGLHLRAGNTKARVFEIHGNIDFMRCAAACNDTLTPIPTDLPEFARDTPLDGAVLARLRCPACGGNSRPHVLWFDECYSESLFFADTAMRKASQAEALVVVGTSGATTLPMHIGAVAAQRGILMVDINPEDNAFGELARTAGGHCLRASASQALRAIANLQARPAIA